MYRKHSFRLTNGQNVLHMHTVSVYMCNDTYYKTNYADSCVTLEIKRIQRKGGILFFITYKYP